MNINLTLIAQAVASAFIWFCAQFIWPPLMRAIETRQKQIADGLAAGEQGRSELANAEKRDEEMLARSQGARRRRSSPSARSRPTTIEEAKTMPRPRATASSPPPRPRSSRKSARAKESCATRSPPWRSRAPRRSCSAKSTPRRTPTCSTATQARALRRDRMAEIATIARPYAEAAFRSPASRTRCLCGRRC